MLSTRIGSIIFIISFVMKLRYTASNEYNYINYICYPNLFLGNNVTNEQLLHMYDNFENQIHQESCSHCKSYGDGYVMYPDKFKNIILPRGFNETDDRILQQLSLKPKASHTKKILIYSVDGLGDKPEGSDLFLQNKCHVTACHLTSDREGVISDKETVDAVIFDNKPWGLHQFVKKPNQIWILNLMESPYHTVNLSQFGSNINWTATYRTDSTIVVPYDKYIKDSPDAGNKHTKQPNHATSKTKMAAIFVSNCFSYSGRLAYVRELEKYVTVDVFGTCGNMTCQRDEMDKCYHLLKSQYKFYLAFENSLCKDYITEKFFWHALRNDIVPVVMGASYEEYTRVAPPNSFIHVDNFTSPEELANFLTYLDQNDDVYNKYFDWKTMGSLTDTTFWCRLCAMLHADLPNLWYNDVHQWYKGKHLCGTNSKYDDISLLEL